MHYILYGEKYSHIKELEPGAELGIFFLVGAFLKILIYLKGFFAICWGAGRGMALASPTLISPLVGAHPSVDVHRKDYPYSVYEVYNIS